MKRWLLAIALTGCSSTPATSSNGTPPPGSSPNSEGGIALGTPEAGAQNDGGAGVDATTDAGPPAPPAPPAAYVTPDDLAKALESATLTMGDSGNADATITLDPSTTYQAMVGFGASMTDSSSYVMTKYLSKDDLQKTLEKLFDPNLGVGLDFLRQPMGASDFSSAGNFSYDDTNQDTSLANFSIAQDLKATIPVLKQLLAINPQVFIMGTPWSPPSWMKNNSSMNGTGGTGGGSSGLAGAAYAPFAQYFVKFIQAYAKEGITVGAVTPQNEPLNGSATYPGMDLNAPSELTLIAKNMGPAFAAAGLKTFIWAYDHNWDVESYPEQVIGDATAGGFTEGAAFHCYGGDASAMSTFHDKFPGKSIYMTECSGGDWQGDAFANTIDLVLDSTANWARAIALWNMALDEKNGPTNNGCATCRGVITVNSQSGQVTYNADYYALGHFSKFVRPGATRIGSKSSSGDLKQVAFVNTDGRIVVVAHNTGSGDKTVRVGSGASAMSVSVPANGAVTFAWTPGG